MESVPWRTHRVIKFKRIRWYCIIAIVNRDSIMYYTPFEPCLRFLVPPHFTNKTRADIMVDNFNGWQQDFNVLILECFESGINVSINTVCARCRDTNYYEMDSRCE
jgi:hypothetical protein